MAAFEHATMPETDVEENRTLLRKADGMKHPLHILVTNQTPMPYAKPPLSCKVKKSASTPDAFFETPATVAVTPEDFDSLGSVHKQFCITEKNLDASSTEAASSKSSVESDTFRFGREPSPQQRGRALFSLEVVDDLDDDSEAEIEILNIGRGLRRAYSDLGCPLHHTLSLHINSAGPPVPKAHCGCQYEDSRRMIRSRRPSNHQVETFPSSCDHSAALHFHDCPIPVVVKLRDDEQQAYILGNDCSTYVTEQDGTQGPIRRRRRRRSDSSWLRLSRRLATTKHMVWLLSLVGLTWVCVIITANHRISQGDIEQNDHISVLFRRALHDQRGFALPPPTSTLRGLTQPGNKTHHRAVNLHTLAQVHDDEQTIVKSTSKVTKQQHPSGKPRHKEATTRMDRRSRSSYNHVNNADHRRRGSGHLPHHSHALHFIEDHQQHHQNHLKPINEYVKAKPGISGTSAVTGVIYPNDLIVRIEPVFTSIDRNLYSQGLGTADESGRPRIVTLDSFSSEIVQSTHMSVQQYPADFTDSTQLYSIYDSGDERISTMEMRAPFMKDECVPMQEWQTTFNPFCNGMHELDMAGIGDNRNEDDFKLFGMNGFWRNAWRYDSTSGHTDLSERDTVVLKTLRINHRFEDAYFENNRIDAVVLERLTASKHVINVFGFCGHSVITEYADGKRLGDLADKMAKIPSARLKIARDIASGLADVHGIDGDGNATFVHFDINPANVVSIGGTLKLNDFNIGVLRRWNTISNSPCGIPAQYPNPQWRSPEEARLEQNLTEKVDVFSLGHIFFRLICGHEPWHKLEVGGMPAKDILNEKVKQGILPTIPDDVMYSSDAEIVSIRDAMLRCYTYDPVNRPSAREIANSLQDALNKLETIAEVA